ncbi:sensor histidine kinase [Streptomyces noursei]|uniref:sensor histidine kinase n=1 Tax=Streptomyces noursei TaxID=1971 RepID=UPI0030F0FAD7
MAFLTSSVGLVLTLRHGVLMRVSVDQALPLNMPLAVTLSGCGLLVLRRERQNGTGWSLLVLGAAFGVIGLASVLWNLRQLGSAAGDLIPFRWRHVLVAAALFAKDGCLALMPLWYLRLGPTRRRWPRAVVCGMVVSYLAYWLPCVWFWMHALGPSWDPALHHPLWAALGTPIIWMSRILAVVCGLWLARSLWWQEPPGPVRRQVTVFLACFTVHWCVSIADMVGQQLHRELSPAWLDFITSGPVLLGLAFIAVAALARQDLGFMERLARQTFLVLGLTLGLYASYRILLQIGENLLDWAPATSATVAAASAAIALRPVAVRLWRLLDWMFYGRRAEPYQAVRALAEALQEWLSADAVAQRVCLIVVDQLGFPHAQLQAVGADGRYPLASVGAAGDRLLHTMELRYRGEVVGALNVACRHGISRIDASDTKALTALCHAAAPMVDALRVREQLRESRDHIVAVREEERRRLRRDLHDGLGPAVAGVRLRLDAALTRMADGRPSPDLVQSAVEQSASILQEVRRLIDGLGPSEVDELGLPRALEQLGERMSNTGTAITVSCPPQLGELPAATENAAYRIAGEALTNVIKHARASSARLDVHAEPGWINFTISDNGIGIGNAPAKTGHSGVGRRSMRERAEQAGGSCRIETRPAGGTQVVVRLPAQP